MYKKNIFITGNSSGLGYGLTKHYLEQDAAIYGLSRRGCRGLSGELYDTRCDLSNFETIPSALNKLLGRQKTLDLVILNAGVLGKIEDLHKTPLDEIQHVMDINVWANKIILDWLLKQEIAISQIVFISSGASINGNRGWNAYSLSKATLNMLAKLYAHEFPQTHISALAPGLIHTAMQDVLCNEVNTKQFPSVQKLKDALGTPNMPDENKAGEIIAVAISQLLTHETGSFIDVRQLDKI